MRWWPLALIATGPSLAWLVAGYQPWGTSVSIASVAAAAVVLTWAAIHIEPRVVKRPGVFINYRREDCAGQAGRLSNGLLAGLGREHVFIDIEGIRPGADFGARIEDAIGSCKVMLALIGPRWLEIKDAERKRRLDDPEDFVRREIEAGLAATHMTVIPVLVERTPMPAAAGLPDTLAPLTAFHAFELSSNWNWAHEETRLIKALRRELGILSAPLVAGLTNVLMAVLLAVTILAVSGGRSGTAATTRLLRNDDLTVTVLPSWKPRAVPAIPGFDPASARAATNGGAGFVAAAFVKGDTDRTLLPRKLLDALKDRTPARASVRVAGGEAYRYDDLAPRGVSQRLTVYAMLATGGVALVACGTSQRAPSDRCRSVADSLRLRSAGLLPIAPSNGYRGAVTRTFAMLGPRLREHDTFRRAGEATARAAVAGRLARDYGAAVAPLRRGVVNPLDGGLNAGLVTAFRQASSAFRRAARAYRSADAEAIARVRATLSRVWPRLRVATAAVERAAHSRLDLPRPPRLPRQTRQPASSVPPPPTSGSSRGVRRVPPPSARPPAPPPAPPSANPGGGDG